MMPRLNTGLPRLARLRSLPRATIFLFCFAIWTSNLAGQEPETPRAAPQGTPVAPKESPDLDSSSDAKSSGLSIYDAARSGTLEPMKSRQRDGVDLNAPDPAGWTALQLAVWHSQAEAAQWLIDQGARRDIQTPFGQSLLDLATATGDPQTILVVLGSDTSPLVLSTLPIEALKPLCKQAAVRSKDDSRRSILHYAALRGRADVVELLLEHGFHIDEQDRVGMTALHLAAASDDSDTVEVLLKHGAKVDLRDRSQRTPLHLAALNASRETVELLLEHGADPDVEGGHRTPRAEAELAFNLDALDAFDGVPDSMPVAGATPSVLPEPGAMPASPTLPQDQALPAASVPAPDAPSAPDASPRKSAPERMLSAVGLELRASQAGERQVAGVSSGLTVMSVTARSMAPRIDIRPGDLIVSINSEPLSEPRQFNRLLVRELQNRAASVRLQVLRPSESVSRNPDLPLPTRGDKYTTSDNAYSLSIPFGWFLMRGYRNTAPDEQFDSLISPELDLVVIIARRGVGLNDPVVDLNAYVLEKLTDAREYADARLEPIQVGGTPAFRVSYRIPDQRITISRVAFAHGRARYILNAVAYDSDDSALPKEFQALLNSIQTHETPVSPAPQPQPSPPGRQIVRSEFGRHTRPPMIGVWAVSAGTPAAHALGIETPLGAVLKECQRDGSAYQAGLRQGDIIVRFGSREINNFEDFECAVLSVPIGSRNSVTFVRGMTRMETQLTLGVGPPGRRVYHDYQHAPGGYMIRLPATWTIERTKVDAATNVNAHDLLISQDGNYRLHCYRASRAVSDPDRELQQIESVMQRDLGEAAKIFRVNDLPVPLAVGGVPYQADRQVVLYRLVFVSDGQLYVIDAFAPVLSDPETLPAVLRSLLGTLHSAK